MMEEEIENNANSEPAGEPKEQRIVTEENLIDFIFFTLYTNLDKNEMHLENEILAPTNIPIDAKQIEHIRELLLATGYIKASIGFGKNGFVYLNQNGIQLMNSYKSYSAYMAANLGGRMQPRHVNNESASQNKAIEHNEPLHFLENDEAE